MEAINPKRTAPQTNVIPFISGAEGFSMRRKALKQSIDSVRERWATYRAPQDDMPALVRKPLDESPEAHARRFAFMQTHIVNFESNLYRATVWLKVPPAAGNPFGIGAEFSGRTLAHAVDAAIEFINLSK